LSRALYSPLHYPGDYGFIPGTIADDGGYLDLLCLVNAPGATGTVCSVRPVAVLTMLDRDRKDHKVLGVRIGDPRQDEVRNLSDVNRHTVDEIEHFFEIYKDLEGIRLIVGGWGDRDAAYDVINGARQLCLEKEAQATTRSA
jgi:inorganic pyrophosphatase